MKKNTTYLLLGAFLILAILILYLNSQKKRNNLDFGVSFSVPQTKKVDKIIIGSGTKNSLILTKGKNFWLMMQKVMKRSGK